MQGWILKQVERTLIDPSPAWRKRWLILDQDQHLLLYYLKPDSKTPKGFIDLRLMTGIVFRPDNFGHISDREAVGFQILTPYRRYNLLAESSNDLLDWRAAIETAYLALQTPQRRTQAATAQHRNSTRKTSNPFRVTNWRKSISPAAQRPNGMHSSSWSVSPQCSVLLELLLSPKNLWHFWAFSEHIHSSENVSFWLETNSLKGCSPEHLPTRIFQIGKKYLSDAAPWEINVDFAARAKAFDMCFAGTAEPSPAIFDGLVMLVENLLSNDCVMKYRNSQVKIAGASPSLPSLALIWRLAHHPVLGIPIVCEKPASPASSAAFSGVLLWEWLVHTFQEYNIISEEQSMSICHQLYRNGNIKEIESHSQL